jgi:hypothetical protein
MLNTHSQVCKAERTHAWSCCGWPSLTFHQERMLGNWRMPGKAESKNRLWGLKPPGPLGSGRISFGSYQFGSVSCHSSGHSDECRYWQPCLCAASGHTDLSWLGHPFACLPEVYRTLPPPRSLCSFLSLLPVAPFSSRVVHAELTLNFLS